MKSMEILKLNSTQSLVQISYTSENVQYCVCSDYDDNAAEGEKWNYGHYFYDLDDAIDYIMDEILLLSPDDTPIGKLINAFADKNLRYKTIACNAIRLGGLEIKYESQEELLKELDATQSEFYEIIELDF